MEDLHTRMVKLREKCLSCWSKEYADLFPQKQNKMVADDELKKYGYPKCQCDDDAMDKKNELFT